MKEYVFKVSRIVWDTFDDETNKYSSQESLGLPSTVNIYIHEDDFSDSIEKLDERELYKELYDSIERILTDNYGYLLIFYSVSSDPIKVNEF